MVSSQRQLNAFALAILISGLSGCGGSADMAVDSQKSQLLKKYPNEESAVSIVQLLANRDRYDGKQVRINGFLRVEFEGDAIYLSKDDADYGISENGFWLNFDKESREDLKKFDRKYVRIEGRFNKEHRGHGSLWQGAIENVTGVSELSRNE